MCCLRYIVMCHYQESVTTGQTDRHTDGQTDRRRTKWSLCVAMLRRRHNKMKADGTFLHSTVEVYCVKGWILDKSAVWESLFSHRTTGLASEIFFLTALLILPSWLSKCLWRFLLICIYTWREVVARFLFYLDCYGIISEDISLS